ncbi:hypothetical protein ACVWWN_004628 [Mycobacterium sp. URHB0021]|jgi:hypothetical protein
MTLDVDVATDWALEDATVGLLVTSGAYFPAQQRIRTTTI